MTDLALLAMQFLAHYLVHSTVLLFVTWFVLSRCSANDHWLRDRGWKWAALAGVLTTVFQMGSGLATPVWQVEMSLAKAASKEASTTANEPPLHESVTTPSIQSSEPTKQLDRVEEDSKTGQQPVVPLMESPTPVDEQSTSDFEVAAAQQTDAPSESSATSLSTIAGLIASILSFFAVLGIVRAANQSRWWRRQLKSARPANATSQKVLKQFLREAKIDREVKLLVSTHCPEPLAMGTFRWRILLPVGLDEELDEEQLKALFGHELAHLVRRDPLWLMIGQMLCTVLPIQPLNFFARRQWRAAAEFVCDDWAIRHGVTKLALAQCLTAVAEWRMNRQINDMALAAGGSPSSLPQRVERLLDDKPSDCWGTTWQRWPRSFCALALFVAFAMYAPQLVQAGPESSPPLGDLPELNGKPDQLELDGSDHPELRQFDIQLAALRSELSQLKAVGEDDAQVTEAIARLHRLMESLQADYQTLRELARELQSD